MNKDLLENNPLITRVFYIEKEETLSPLYDISFDMILSLEEGQEILSMMKNMKYQSLVGIYLDENNIIQYTEPGKAWFDMSLISRYGKEKADILKIQNQESYQHFLFAMLGKEFVDQEYSLPYEPNQHPKYVVGIEKRAWGRRPTKRRGGYDEVIEHLEKNQISYVIFQERDTIKEYIDDINDCKVLVCGDTLAMHIGMALKKQVVTIFWPTAPQEIYGYGRLKKLYNPDSPCFCNYKPACPHEIQCIDTVSTDEVVQAILDSIKMAW